MDDLPDEILTEIFSYLDVGDLRNCLQVSRRWRVVANSNFLWKRHCKEIGIYDIPIPGSYELCDWAAAFFAYHCIPKKNWRHGRYTVYMLPLVSRDYVADWQENRACIYYYKINRLFLHEIHSHGLYTSELSPPSISGSIESYSLSLKLNNQFLAIAKTNIVILYKRKADSFEPERIITVSNGKLRFLCYNNRILEEISLRMVYFTIEVEAITSSNILWLKDNEEDNFHIIDLKDFNLLKTLPSNNFLLYSDYSKFLVSWWEAVNVYDHKGNIIFSSISDCWQVALNTRIIALGVKETQKVEVWDIGSNKKIFSKSVLYQTDLAIHPQKDVLVLTEKNFNVYRITCYDVLTGNTWWRIHPQQEHRCHSVDIVFDYVFVQYRVDSRDIFDILDLRNGKLIREGFLIQNKIHLSNTVCVCDLHEDYDQLTVRSFIGHI